MPNPVVAGATCMCTMGTSPGTLNAAACPVRIGGKPALTIQDMQPMMNVGACGMCTSLANSAVASATAAALGVLTPQPCVPSPLGMWVCGRAFTIGGRPVLTSDGTLNCAYGGSITIKNAGQQNVRV